LIARATPVEFDASQEPCRFASARPPLLRPGPAHAGPSRFRAAGPPLLGFLLPRTQRRRVPLFAAPAREPVRWARVATPPPVPSSGFLPLSTVTGFARGTHGPFRTRRSPWRPDASRPCSMPLASLELPSRAFPSRGAVPTLVSPCFPAGSLSDHRQRSVAGTFTIAFAVAPSPLPRAPPEGGTWTHEPGRRFPAVAIRSLEPAAKRAFANRPFPPTLGSPVSSRHARFEALLPPGVRSRNDPSLARVRSSGRCSPGLLPL